MWSLGQNGWKQRGSTWRSPGFVQGPAFPANGVSWEDAQAFCRWLTEKERRENRLRLGQEYRLPTDAEWSIAAGLGPESGKTPSDKDSKIKGVYPWGTQWPPPSGVGNYADETAKRVCPNWIIIKEYDDGYAQTAPVGCFQASQFGLYDMGGNVWEWCEDKCRPPSDSRVLRGASCQSYGSGCLLSSFRGGAHPASRHQFVGFRCVLVMGDTR
jgi:formylglycine-generating enzyme required for sulfatase activity